jgi:hypothetical protein
MTYTFNGAEFAWFMFAAFVIGFIVCALIVGSMEKDEIKYGFKTWKGKIYDVRERVGHD